MTTLLYGRPPVVFDPPGDATQTSPLIPDSAALEAQEPSSADSVMIYAPPGVLERRYVLALALKALKVGGRLDVMAPKDKGGSRLAKELKAFGVEVAETAKAHHRRCIVIRPERSRGWTKPSPRASRRSCRGWRPGRSPACSPGTGSIRARRCWPNICRR